MLFFAVANATFCCVFLLYQTHMAGIRFELIKVGQASEGRKLNKVSLN